MTSWEVSATPKYQSGLCTIRNPAIDTEDELSEQSKAFKKLTENRPNYSFRIDWK
jgi:hypothetical protein